MREFNLPHISSRSLPVDQPRSAWFIAALWIVLGLGGCTSVSQSAVMESTNLKPEVRHRIHATTFSVDGLSYYYAEGGETCILRRIAVATGDEDMARELGFCPTRLTHFADGGLLASSEDDSIWLASDGGVLFEDRNIVAAASPSRFLEKTAEGLSWTDGETQISLTVPELRNPRIARGEILVGIVTGDGVERLVRFDGGEPNALTPTFPSIGSYDVSPDGKELVFSVEHEETGFDVGLVSVDGSEIIWVPADPADERLVTWAPRGNKITYTIESHDATVLRSVHIPTTYQLTFDVPLTSVKEIRWEPKAELFAMVLESPTSGPWVDLVEYDGDNRRPLVGAKESVESTIDITTWEGGSGFLLGPTRVRYEDKLPVAVWIASDGIFDWRPAVARARLEGVGIVLVRGDTLDDSSGAFNDVVWADPARRYVVDAAGVITSLDQIAAGQTLITREDLAPRGERRVIRVSGAVSFEDAAVEAILGDLAN